MEEFLKGGNRFQTEELGQKKGVVFFELLMWARKNLGDMVEVEEALPLYESMIGEDEILYLQKHYSIYRVCKVLNLPEKANDAARSIIKILPSYKNINIDVVEYLTTSKNYYNALEIAIGEYNKNNITHWINAINNICVTAEELSLDCVDEVIEFSEILMADLKVVEWSNIILSLYKNIRSVETSVIRVLDYLRKSFKKINYKQNDFINCSQAITVLNEIYEDIRICKYNQVYLRDYEFDFTFYLMNTAVQNESYEKVFSNMGNAILNTYLYGIAAIIIIVLLGMFIAYISIRRRNILTSLIDSITMFPYIIPGSVLGITLLMAFNKKPIILSGTVTIMVIAFVIRRLPYTLRSSAAILYQLSPSMEEASISLGCSPMKTFFKVTAVMMLPGVLSGAILSWITVTNEISASVILYTGKTRTMSVSIYSEVVRASYGTAAALSTILTMTTIVSLMIFYKVSNNKEISV